MAFWLDEEWHAWEQIDAAGTAAAGLYARCGSYIANRKTDGFIPSARARMYGTPEWIQRLVDVGLWTVEEDGFRDARYFELNRPAAEIAKSKKQAAARQQNYIKRLTAQSRTTDASAQRQATRSPFPTPFGGKGRGALKAAHPFDDDGQGMCLTCSLPYKNAVHGVAS